MYYDKNGKPITNGDILCFGDIGCFEVVIKNNIILKKCDDDTFPKLLLKKMVLDFCIKSACVVEGK